VAPVPADPPEAGGAVGYQREEHWCDGCRRVVPHLRAVRAADNWHSDWTCCALASTGEHAPPERRDGW